MKPTLPRNRELGTELLPVRVSGDTEGGREEKAEKMEEIRERRKELVASKAVGYLACQKICS